MREIGVILCLVVIGACAVPQQPPLPDQSPVSADAGNLSGEDTEILFVDIDSFDTQLTSAMQQRSRQITLTFIGESVTSNNIPERLNKWLAATDKIGHGLKVESTTGVASKGLLSFLALLPAGYQYLKDEYAASLTRSYGATLYYDPRTAVISTVVLDRRLP